MNHHIYFLLFLLSLFLALIMWPFFVTFTVAYIYMIEQLWCLYTFFSLRWTRFDEMRKEEQARPKKNERQTQWRIRKKRISFSFLSRLFSHLLRNGRRRKKEYASCSSFILVLSFSRYISALLLLLLFYTLSCIYNITLHHHTHTGTSFFSSFSFSRVAFHYCVIICSKHAKRHLL